jgi:sugar phosphate isomerase/epimerase
MMKIGLIGIVGDEAKRDFWGTYARVAEMGYQGIEAVEGVLLEGDATANVRRFEELGLRNLTTSAGREDLRDRLDVVRQRALDSGATRVSVWWSEANDREVLLRDAELYEASARRLAEDGLRLCYHNHDHEFRNVFADGNALDLLAANTETLCFTIDVGWVAVGGADPATVLRSLKGRVPAIHVKDFADVADRESFTAVGSGAVPFGSALPAATEAGVEWAVVEQDRLRNLSGLDTAHASALNLRERGLR